MKRPKHTLGQHSVTTLINVVAMDQVRTECTTAQVKVVLLQIPSSHPNQRTFPQFVRIQIRRFLAAINDGFETAV